jgi:hypothetical protein
MHVSTQPAPGIGLVYFGAAGKLSCLRKHVERNRALKGGPIGEPSVQGGDADTGAPRDVVEGCIGALFDEHLACGGEELLAVATGVRAQPSLAICG